VVRKRIEDVDPHIVATLFQSWFAAAETGNAELIASFLNDYEIPVDRIGPRGTTALMESAFGGHLHALEVLLDAGARMDHEAPAGGTALSYAAVGNHPDAVALLARRGAILDLADSRRGLTALGQATLRKHEEVISALLDAGASVWAGTPSAIEVAVGAPSRDVYDRMRQHPTHSPTPPDATSRLFWFAAAGGQRTVADELLSSGARGDILVNGNDALHQCARIGATQMIPWLVARGLDPNRRNESGWTPLLLATKDGHPDTAIALLDAGARPDDPEPVVRVTALVHAAVGGYEDLVRALLAHGADPDFVDEQAGRRAVDWAREAGHEAIVRIFAEA
jgi:ankyrin repeat protein